MPWSLAISTPCASILSGIDTVSRDLNAFANVGQGTSSDANEFNKELQSLYTTVVLLQSTELHLPDHLESRLSGILQQCGGTIQELRASIDHDAANAREGSAQTALISREDTRRIRERLGTHVAVLDLTVGVVNAVKVDLVKDDTTAIREELLALRLRMLQFETKADNPMLQRYLQETISYTDSVVDASEQRDDKRTNVEIMSAQLDSAYTDDSNADEETYASSPPTPDMIPTTIHKHSHQDGNTSSPGVKAHENRQITLSRLTEQEADERTTRRGADASSSLASGSKQLTEHVNSPPDGAISVKVKVHDDGRVTLRGLTEEERRVEFAARRQTDASSSLVEGSALVPSQTKSHGNDLTSPFTSMGVQVHDDGRVILRGLTEQEAAEHATTRRTDSSSLLKPGSTLDLGHIQSRQNGVLSPVTSLKLETNSDGHVVLRGPTEEETGAERAALRRVRRERLRRERLSRSLSSSDADDDDDRRYPETPPDARPDRPNSHTGHVTLRRLTEQEAAAERATRRRERQRRSLSIDGSERWRRTVDIENTQLGRPHTGSLPPPKARPADLTYAAGASLDQQRLSALSRSNQPPHAEYRSSPAVRPQVSDDESLGTALRRSGIRDIVDGAPYWVDRIYYSGPSFTEHLVYVEQSLPILFRDLGLLMCWIQSHCMATPWNKDAIALVFDQGARIDMTLNAVPPGLLPKRCAVCSAGRCRYLGERQRGRWTFLHLIAYDIALEESVDFTMLSLLRGEQQRDARQSLPFSRSTKNFSNTLNEYGETPIHTTIMYGFRSNLRYMIGPDTDWLSLTPLLQDGERLASALITWINLASDAQMAHGILGGPETSTEEVIPHAFEIIDSIWVDNIAGDLRVKVKMPGFCHYRCWRKDQQVFCHEWLVKAYRNNSALFKRSYEDLMQRCGLSIVHCPYPGFRLVELGGIRAARPHDVYPEL